MHVVSLTAWIEISAKDLDRREMKLEVDFLINHFHLIVLVEIISAAKSVGTFFDILYVRFPIETAVVAKRKLS